MKQHFAIRGSARALPKSVISADELDRRLGLEAGWTAHHTGVHHRHQFSGRDEFDGLVRQVCLGALADAGQPLATVDMIIDASLCIQQIIPCNAALVQRALGDEAKGIQAIDVHASCLGFLAALNVVNGLFAAGSVKRALLVCAEAPLTGVNWSEPESACLMGDGAVAFVLEAAPGRESFGFLFETYAEGSRLCEIRGGGLHQPGSSYEGSQRAEFQFHMDGKAVHKFASQRFPGLVSRVAAMAGRSLGALNFVPHQASGPALEFMRRRLEIVEERFHVSIAEHGNMVAASIPFVLDRVRRLLPAGSPVMALGTAAGYAQAAAIFEL